MFKAWSTCNQIKILDIDYQSCDEEEERADERSGDNLWIQVDSGERRCSCRPPRKTVVRGMGDMDKERPRGFRKAQKEKGRQADREQRQPYSKP